MGQTTCASESPGAPRRALGHSSLAVPATPQTGHDGHRRADPEHGPRTARHTSRQTPRRRTGSSDSLASSRESGRPSCTRRGTNAGRVSGFRCQQALLAWCRRCVCSLRSRADAGISSRSCRSPRPPPQPATRSRSRRARGCPKAEALGFETFAAGWDEGLVPVRRPLIAVDAEAEIVAFRDGFARLVANQRLPDLVELCDSWSPEAIVREETDFAAPIVAERNGIPHASVVVLAAGGAIRPICPRAGTVAERVPLAGGSRPCDAHSPPVLAPLPPSSRDPAWPLPATSRPIRPTLRKPSPQERSPPGLQDRRCPGRLLQSRDGLPRRVRSSLRPRRRGPRDLPIDRSSRSATRSTPRSSARSHRTCTSSASSSRSQARPRRAAVVSHGGSGSVIGALDMACRGPPPARRRPAAQRRPLRGVGIGQALDPVTATPAACARP